MSAPAPLQRTLAQPAEAHGVALHGGGEVVARLHPAPVGHGLRFRRVDLPSAPEIPALLNQVRCTRLATRLGEAHGGVSTVEHLLAALSAAGVSNLLIEVNGPELPVLDGSSQGWVEALDEAGIADQGEPAQRAWLRGPVEVQQGERWMRATPAEHLELHATVRFDHPAIGEQSRSLTLSAESFREELSWARTFGFVSEVEQLRAAGLARGGGLHNAVVYASDGVLNPEGLRAPDEAVRHKLLDMVGDLSLLGAPLMARVEAYCPGHALSRALMEAMVSGESPQVVLR